MADFKLSGRKKSNLTLKKRKAFVKERKKQKLYFCRWHEDPKYREEIVVRAYPTGKILEIIPGSWKDMPNGQIWVLR